MRRLFALALVTLLTLPTGCATIMTKSFGTIVPSDYPAPRDLHKQPGLGHVYTGTQCDWDLSYLAFMWPPIGTIALLDIPLSLVGDTIFLPVDLIVARFAPVPIQQPLTYEPTDGHIRVDDYDYSEWRTGQGCYWNFS